MEGLLTDEFGFYMIKRSTSVIDAGFDWIKWLNGDTIVTSSWSVPAGITSTNEGIATDGTQSIVWLSGGTLGAEYKITNTITTQAGRTETWAMRVKIANP